MFESRIILDANHVLGKKNQFSRCHSGREIGDRRTDVTTISAEHIFINYALTKRNSTRYQHCSFWQNTLLNDNRVFYFFFLFVYFLLPNRRNFCLPTLGGKTMLHSSCYTFMFMLNVHCKSL
jgi:hypothetical protein